MTPELPEGYSISPLSIPDIQYSISYQGIQLPTNKYLHTYTSIEDAIRACWQDSYSKIVEEYNKDLVLENYFDRIVSFNLIGRYYHPECLPNGQDLNQLITRKRQRTYRLEDIEHLLCPECGEPIINSEEREEFYEHEWGCGCWSCEKVADLTEEGRYSNLFLLGYDAGLNDYAGIRGLSIEEYQRMVNELSSEYYLGYTAGKVYSDSMPF